MLDLHDSPDEAAFRARLRDWFAANLPDGWADRDPTVGLEDVEFMRDWSRRLYEAGFAGITWPVEHGGLGLSPTYQGIYLEESARHDAPGHVGVIGLGMAGPTIMAWGSPEQKERYLRPLLSGEEIWCQGFSEPGAGSDLASLRTRAVLDGDTWVVDGQKVWSSYAHVADWCLLLCRSDATQERHRGLSYLLVDMHAPGVEVRPLRQITGDPEFNEIYLTGVRVPRESMLGAPGQGWDVAMTTLLHERGTLGFALTARLEQLLGRLVTTARGTTRADGSRAADDPLVRDQVAALAVDLEGLRFTNYRAIAKLVRTGVPGPEGSIAKLHWSEANQRLTALAHELLGAGARLDDTFWGYQHLRSRGNTIEAGTSEILRSIVAERVVGLPRSR
jgi:alkylation response protein AidB-like acyl-CoA dehydrogenase